MVLRLKRGAIILDVAVRCDINQDGDTSTILQVLMRMVH